MKFVSRLIISVILLFLLSSCGAIPTLPPLDSTISVHTAQVTIQVVEVTETPIKYKLKTDTPEIEPSQTPVPQNTSTHTPQLDTATPEPSATVSPSKTPTQKPTNTPTLSPTNTIVPTETILPAVMSYALQHMNPFYLENFTHPEKGCNWMGVAGQVFDESGRVRTDVVVNAGGTLGGKAVLEDMTMPLTNPDIDLAYGPGGFELVLAEGVVATDSEAWIQLYNLTGDPLSEKIMLVTYDDCQKNLILMNFSPK